MQAMSNQISIFDYINSPSSDTTSSNLIPFPTQAPTHPTHPNRKPQQRVSPIRDPQKVDQIYHTLLSSGRYGLRNATIFALQLAIGRRTNDILRMTIQDVYDYKRRAVKSFITVNEHKTGKTARDLPVDAQTQSLIERYIYTLKNKAPTALLFPSQKHNADGSQRPLNTASLDYIYQTYTSQLFSSEDEQTHISSYAARKTYGYNIYKNCMEKHNGFLPGTNIDALHYVQSVYEHETTLMSLRYIGAYDTPAQELAEDISSQYNFLKGNGMDSKRG